MLTPRGTFVAVGLTQQGLLMVADRRRVLGPGVVCDDHRKIHSVDQPPGTAFAIVGLDEVVEGELPTNEDPCGYFRAAEKTVQLNRVVAEHLQRFEVDVTKESTERVARECFTAFEALDREKVADQAGRPLAEVVLARATEGGGFRIAIARFAVASSGDRIDLAVRVVELGDTWSSADRSDLYFGDRSFLEGTVPGELSRVRDLLGRTPLPMAADLEGAAATLVDSAGRVSVSTVAGGIDSILLLRSASGRHVPVCYLCGKVIVGKATADHVPPLQFFPAELRVSENPNLLTLDSHEACNADFKLDEDYFLHSIGPLAPRAGAARFLWRAIFDRLATPRERHLGDAVLAEFDPQPGGIHLPNGRVIKRLSPRVHRVAWKIARGLFYLETGRTLPENTPRSIAVVDTLNPPPEHVKEVLEQRSRGRHPEIFDYRTTGRDRPPVHQIAMLFWGGPAWVLTFHDPTCDCDKCAHSRPESK